MDSTWQIQCMCVVIVIFSLWPCQSLSRTLHDASMLQRYEQWMVQHGRVYTDAVEKESRFKIFKDNVKHIEAFNNRGDRSYKLSINPFADQTNEEFMASRNGYKRSSSVAKSSKAPPFKYENKTVLPSSMDWRQKGAVTPVKDQGNCGSCWAFSTVAAMEGITQLKTGKLISLSEQELVDCDAHGEDQGCDGGLMEEAFKFIQQNKGLNTEVNYPYTGDDDETCNTNKMRSHAASIRGHENVPVNNENALLKAVAYQPVSVSVDFGGADLQFYSGGVCTGDCGTQLNHGVAAVGYGTSENGTKYWLIKNSWVAGWGENGYIRLQRDVNAKEGHCGIAMDACYPIA